MRKIYFLLFFFQVSVLSAQTDKAIKEKDVSASVRDYVKTNYPGAEHLKYYMEKEHDTSFYELSFKYKLDKYDLMFLENGSIYEVERLLKFEELPSEIMNRIKEDLSKRYMSYKIHKAEEVNPGKNTKYEISLHGKKGNHSGYYELFYNKDGIFLTEEEEIVKSIPSNSGF